MKKRFIIAAALGGIAAAGIGGYTYLTYRAEAEIRSGIEDLLSSAKLLHVVEYGDVSVNLFSNAITIDDIRIDDGKGITASIQSITVGDLPRQTERLESLRIDISGLETTEPAAIGFFLDAVSDGDGSHYAKALGIYQVRLNGRLVFKADPEKRKASLELQAEADGLSQMSASLHLGNVAPRALQYKNLGVFRFANARAADIRLFELGEILQGIKLVQELFYPIAIEQASVSYADKGAKAKTADLRGRSLSALYPGGFSFTHVSDQQLQTLRIDQASARSLFSAIERFSSDRTSLSIDLTMRPGAQIRNLVDLSKTLRTRFSPGQEPPADMLSLLSSIRINAKAGG